MGIVVIAVAAFFAYFAYNASDLQVVKGYTVTARFLKVGGLTVGSDVRINGIKVGTVIGQNTFFPNGTLPQPIMKAATSEADTISIPRNVIRQYLEACPAAARMAIYGKALRGGPEMDPNPMAATAAKRPSEMMSSIIIGDCF